MNSYNIIRLGSTVTGTLLVVMLVGFVADGIYGATPPAKPGFVIPVPAAETAAPPTAATAAAPTATAAAPAAPAADAGVAAAAAASIAVRLAKADPSANIKAVLQCVACHTFQKGETKRVGPNLFGVVGGPMGHMEGFAYSPAMLAKKAAGGTWTFDNLDQFLTAPQKFIPGSLMTFTGFADPDARANAIAYLRTLADQPVPLPAP